MGLEEEPARWPSPVMGTPSTALTVANIRGELALGPTLLGP